MDTKKIDDGGPAYPVIAGRHFYSHGMMLRDYFAGQAIAGLCADPSNHELFESSQEAAENAYQIADAMIAARIGGDDEFL